MVWEGAALLKAEAHVPTPAAADICRVVLARDGRGRSKGAQPPITGLSPLSQTKILASVGELDIVNGKGKAVQQFVPEAPHRYVSMHAVLDHTELPATRQRQRLPPLPRPQ